MFASKPMGVDKDLGSRGYGFSVVGGDREKIIVTVNVSDTTVTSAFGSRTQMCTVSL